MKRHQRVKYDMFLLIKAYLLTVVPAILSAIPFLMGWYNDFLLKLDVLINYINTQERHRQGYAVYKANCRLALEQGMSHLVSILQLYSTATNNPILFNAANYTDAAILKLNESELSAAAAVVAQLVQGIISELAQFGVNAITQAEYFEKASAFNLAKTQPRNEIYDKKGATTAIAVTVKLIDELLSKMDIAVRTVRFLQPEFFQQYFERRAVIKPARMQQAGRGSITDQFGNPLPLVRISCSELNLKRKSSRKGKFIIKQAKEGVWEFRFSYPGMETVFQSVTIAKGKRTEIVVVMRDSVVIS